MKPDLKSSIEAIELLKRRDVERLRRLSLKQRGELLSAACRAAVEP